MKKTLILLFVALFATTAVLADDISVEQALQITRQFADSPQTQQLSKRRASRMTAEPTLAYSVKSGVSAKDNVYVINIGNDQGFVIVSGEDGAEDIVLGYCDHGSFSYDNCPVQLKELLTVYSAGVDSLRMNPALAAPQKAVKQWPDYIGSIIVGPLLPTTWNQWGPYNNNCPEGCPTGCYPTALAQVMNYWKWPKQTIGEVDGQDFSGRTYDWDNMLDNYGSSYRQYGGFGPSTEYNSLQAAAVAKLMADIGYAFHTIYAPEGSPTYFLSDALVENFGYEPGIERKHAMQADQLADVMKMELDEKRPILYCGAPDFEETSIPHALVCDGYTDTDYFHFNYGWGGSCDGFYKNALIPLYPCRAYIFTGVRPFDAEYKIINDIKYALLKNGTAEIIKYMRSYESGITLEIPATVADDEGNEYKVTRIRRHAFMTNCNFDKVVIGENVEVVEPFAFIHSTINELVLSDKMEIVPDEAFQLTNINTLTIGANIKRIGKRAFRMCKLYHVTCKSPAFEADDEAFFACGEVDCGEWLGCITKLGREAFAMGIFKKKPVFTQLEEIGPKAFVSCTFPNSEFQLPPKLKKISPDAFYMGMFFGFEPNEANPCFDASRSGLLYNNNQTSLVLAPLANWDIEAWSLPETLTKMEPGCVMSRRSQSSKSYYGFEIPNTIVEMEGAFNNCETLGKLKCLAVVPPMITDETFNDKIFENKPDITLYVPEGTEELYRNAPGWRRFPNIVGDQEYNPAPAQARQYYMVVNGNTDEGRVSIPLSEVNSMEISDDGLQVIIKRNGKDDVIAPVSVVDSITWMPGFVFENAEVFDLTDSTLTVDAQKCSVTFDATTIDDDVQLCIRNSVFTPKVLENAVRGYAVDLSLSNDEHELSGTAQLTLPVTLSEGEKVHAAYFNEETGKWEPVYFKYDEGQQAVIITTDHLSTFGIFTTTDELDNTMQAVFELAYESFPELREFNDATKYLLDIVSSDDPEKEQIHALMGDMSTMQTLGLDIVYNAISGVGNPLGFSPEKINNAVEVMGYLGTAVSILDVVGADIKGDEIGVASGTLSTILNYTTGQLASAIGTPVMSASMACVAFIGVALNKLGTTVQQSKHDLYSKAYHYFYSKKYKPTCYRSAKDWYNYFYPVIAEGKMTKNRLDAFIEQSVRVYCDQFWSGAYKSDFDFCCAEMDVRSLSTYMYPEEALQKQISDEYFAELMNGELVSVFTAIKNNLATQANKRAVSAANAVATELNTKVGIRVSDSEWKEGAKSKYAGWKIGFSEVPDVVKDKEKWTKTLNDKGRAGIGFFTEFSLMQNKMKPQLTLYNEEDVEQKTYSFSIPDGTGAAYVNIDLATDGVEVEAPKLKGLELTYNPNKIETPWTMSGTLYYEDLEGNLVSEPYRTEDGVGVSIALDGTFCQNARFQHEIEKFFKRHDFITVDNSGNITIGGDIVGKMNGHEGTGKFTIKTSYPFVEKTVEESALRFSSGDKYDMAEKMLSLLNGTLQHKISGTFTVTRNHGDTYTVSYTGEGTYTLDAEVFDNVDGWKWYEGGNAETLFDNVKILPEGITTKKITAEGDVTLKYTTTLKE